MQYNLKAKTIINTSLGLDIFFLVLHYNSTREMWDTLWVTHEGTIDVKMVRMNILTHKYESFKTKTKENIQDMQRKNWYSKPFKNSKEKNQNEDLIHKFLICLNHSWEPKVTLI